MLTIVVLTRGPTITLHSSIAWQRNAKEENTKLTAQLAALTASKAALSKELQGRTAEMVKTQKGGDAVTKSINQSNTVSDIVFVDVGTIQGTRWTHACVCV